MEHLDEDKMLLLILIEQIETDTGPEWSIYFPGIPGVCGGGKTPGKALDDAIDILNAHFKFLKEENDEID